MDRRTTPPTSALRPRPATSLAVGSRSNSPCLKRAAKCRIPSLKIVSPERDALFLRYYAKFDGGFNVAGSSHNGSTISAHYCCPGVRADGYNKFLVSYEAWRDSTATANPGRLNAYIYHPEQRDIWGDHFFPTGIVLPFSSVPFDFGPEFVSRPDVTPVLGRWYCYEMMVKANTPGQRDGRIAFWLDGQLIADFPNLRLRETTALKIDRFTLDLHVFNNNLAVARKWYDNVVAATSYIGPMVSGPRPPAAPLRVARNVLLTKTRRVSLRAFVMKCVVGASGDS